MDDSIPVVDFEACGLLRPSVEKAETGYSHEVTSVVDEIGRAFREYGFVYLLNHGVDQRLIDRVTEVSNTFFQLPTAKKERYRMTRFAVQGWVSMGIEQMCHGTLITSKKAKLDPMENMGNIKFYEVQWPNDLNSDAPNFFDVNKECFEACCELTKRVLKVLGIALNPQDDNYFVDTHKHMGDPRKCQTVLRPLYYPKLKEPPLDDQMRLGEHSDYGSITLLFQDNTGGLEVKKGNDYIPALPIPGSVIVNSGDMLQRWTADQVIAAKHRVGIPKEESTLQNVRRSIVFFVNPDDDALIKCIDGSDKYEAITSYDYLLRKYEGLLVCAKIFQTEAAHYWKKKKNVEDRFSCHVPLVNFAMRSTLGSGEEETPLAAFRDVLRKPDV